jgi:hypothetical protein
MSKGSSKRPLSIPKEQFNDNWNKIFNVAVPKTKERKTHNGDKQ